MKRARLILAAASVVFPGGLFACSNLLGIDGEYNVGLQTGGTEMDATVPEGGTIQTPPDDGSVAMNTDAGIDAADSAITSDAGDAGSCASFPTGDVFFSNAGDPSSIAADPTADNRVYWSDGDRVRLVLGSFEQTPMIAAGAGNVSVVTVRAANQTIMKQLVYFTYGTNIYEGTFSPSQSSRVITPLAGVAAYRSVHVDEPMPGFTDIYAYFSGGTAVNSRQIVGSGYCATNPCGTPTDEGAATNVFLAGDYLWWQRGTEVRHCRRYDCAAISTGSYTPSIAGLNRIVRYNATNSFLLSTPTQIVLQTAANPGAGNAAAPQALPPAAAVPVASVSIATVSSGTIGALVAEAGQVYYGVNSCAGCEVFRVAGTGGASTSKGRWAGATCDAITLSSAKVYVADRTGHRILSAAKN